MKAVCVFCGSNTGLRPEFTEGARSLGKLIAERNYTLVYGGGNVGLMGELAQAAISSGGEVVGVIPEAIYRLVDHAEITSLQVVPDMHTRKNTMYELSDGFIALPGGIGTIEELMEIYTWGQLGYHTKPVGICNIAGFYDAFLEFFRHMVDSQFLKPVHHKNLLVSDSPEKLLDKMESFKPVLANKLMK